MWENFHNFHTGDGQGLPIFTNKVKVSIEIGHFVLSYQEKNDKQKLKEAENHLPNNAHNAS